MDEIDVGKIFVGGISHSTSDAGFRTYFEKFGELRDCVLMRDRVTNAHRGFGFVTFVDASTVQRVVSVDNELDGKKLDCKQAKVRGDPSLGNRGPPSAVAPRSAGPRACKIFVGGLSAETTEANFKEYFGQYGQVTDSIVMKVRETGAPRGFGFVTFTNADAAELVCQTRMHEIAGKQVEVKIAEDRPREARGGMGGFGDRGQPQGWGAAGDWRGGGGYGGGYDASRGGYGGDRSYADRGGRDRDGGYGSFGAGGGGYGGYPAERGAPAAYGGYEAPRAPESYAAGAYAGYGGAPTAYPAAAGYGGGYAAASGARDAYGGAYGASPYSAPAAAPGGYAAPTPAAGGYYGQPAAPAAAPQRGGGRFNPY